jgi:hypothetical protein
VDLSVEWRSLLRGSIVAEAQFLSPELNLVQGKSDADSQLGNVNFSGSLRTRVYGWNWFAPSSGDNHYVFSGSILRLGISQKRGNWNWNAEFALPMLLGLPANATGTGPQQGALGFGGNYFTANGESQNAAMVFPKQLYVRLNGLGGSKTNQPGNGRLSFWMAAKSCQEPDPRS